MRVRRVSLMHECIFARPQREKIVESLKKGVPKVSERTALRARARHPKTLLRKAG
jgi:hypothetical protein